LPRAAVSKGLVAALRDASHLSQRRYLSGRYDRPSLQLLLCVGFFGLLAQSSATVGRVKCHRLPERAREDLFAALEILPLSSAVTCPCLITVASVPSVWSAGFCQVPATVGR
jgi:hypothetical protein